MKNVDVDKKKYLARSLLLRRVLNTLLVAKMIEGLAIVYISVKNEWIYKNLHETRYKCFSDDDDELLKKYSKI